MVSFLLLYWIGLQLGTGQAHGLCFSVRPGVQIPPSLVNIYKELSKDIPDFQAPNHGCLTGWAKQGTL
jgi:uracil-DNA glycosylase